MANKRKKRNNKFVKMRPPSKDRRDNKYVFKLKCVFFLAALAACALFGRNLYLKPLSVKETAVKSEIPVLKPDVASLLSFKADAAAERKDSAKIKTDIAKNKSETKNAVVDKADVKIEEKLPLCFIKQDGKTFGMDAGGNIFPIKQAANSKNIPSLLCEADFDLKTAARFVEGLQKADFSFFEDISQIKITPLQVASLTLKNGSKIFWGSLDFEILKQKQIVLKKVLLDAKAKYEKIDYIDMAFYDAGKVLVKPLKNSN
ncbi:MAG: hypothetical protein LBH29_00950 [Elusimicrobiota bacterium]|jgi:cell division septal protein FtsQ|nr:hypothetical protein [Elusimicrobiota bacterium]